MDKEYRYTVFTKCLTYNHAPYIKATLNGFAMQETNFPVVFCIVDDASCDGEQEVLLRWANENLNISDDRVESWTNEKFGRSIVAGHKDKENLLNVNSMSKEFCMTGYRLGYVCGPEKVISAMTKLQENVVACAPLPSQYAAIEALRTDVDYSAGMAAIFSSRRNTLIKEFAKIDSLLCSPPEATFYAMIDITRTNLKSEEFAYALLKSVQVAVVPGITYGDMCDNYIRIAFTLNENKIVEGIRRINNFVKSIKTN